MPLEDEDASGVTQWLLPVLFQVPCRILRTSSGKSLCPNPASSAILPRGPADPSHINPADTSYILIGMYPPGLVLYDLRLRTQALLY